MFRPTRSAQYRTDLEEGNRAVALAMALAAPTLGAQAALALGGTLGKSLDEQVKRQRRYERSKAMERAEILCQMEDGTLSRDTFSAAELYALSVEECLILIERWEAWERLYGPSGPAEADIYDLADEYENHAA